MALWIMLTLCIRGTQSTIGGKTNSSGTLKLASKHECGITWCFLGLFTRTATFLNMWIGLPRTKFILSGTRINWLSRWTRPAAVFAACLVFGKHIPTNQPSTLIQQSPTQWCSQILNSNPTTHNLLLKYMWYNWWASSLVNLWKRKT